ncbi:MAG: DUF507 family protein [bacterium]
MKLRKQQIEKISGRIIDELIARNFIKVDDIERAKALVKKIIIEDLLVEERLNEEVRKLLEAHTSAIKSGSIEYHRIFKMVKDKLVRERQLIL